jgi:hypothetical protein
MAQWKHWGSLCLHAAERWSMAFRRTTRLRKEGPAMTSECCTSALMLKEFSER